jgi:hypothetical protein
VGCYSTTGYGRVKKDIEESKYRRIKKEIMIMEGLTLDPFGTRE